MQYLPIEFVLESSAIFSGVIFALVSLFGIYYYSTDIQYRRWAITHLAFWIAFLPPNIFIGLPYAGDFVSMLLRVFACILLLRAFNFRRLSKLSNHITHPATFLGISMFWIVVVTSSLPSNVSAIPTCTLMAMTFFYVSKEILCNRKDRSKIWLSAGVSYLLWGLASIPMIFFPIFPELIIAGYVQFIGQALVMITMFLSFIGSTRRRVQENLRLTTVLSSLISHDLRNYLNVTQGAIQLVEGNDEESREMLQTAMRSLDSASDFINRVRSVWIDLGAQIIHIDDFDICEIIREVTNRAIKEHSLKEGQIIIDCECKSYVSTTPLISQVIWNIIDNSIRHSRTEPEISISAYSSSSIDLVIMDRSGGLSPQIKKALLTKEESKNGYGLGLMLIREITDIFSIPIDVIDRVEGQDVVGSIFKLSLPHSGGVPVSKS